MLSDAVMQKECRKCKVVFPRRDRTKRMPSLCPVCIAIVPDIKIFTCKKCKIELPPQSAGRKKHHCSDCHKIYIKELKRKNKIDARKWLFAGYLLLTSRKGISSLQISKELNIKQSTAWYMMHRLGLAC